MINQDTFVSIIMPCYNVENYIKKAIDSIQNQTHQCFELLCLDDCSSDKTYSILEQYSIKDSRIKIFKNDQNLGVNKSRNILINKAQYDFILNMDSDDISEINRIEILLNKQAEKQLDIVSSMYTFINKFDEVQETKGLSHLKTQYGIKYITFFNSPIPHAPSLIRKSLINDIGYDVDYTTAEDYKLFSDLLFYKNIKVFIVDTALYLYRLNINGLSKTTHQLQTKNHIKIAKEFILHEFPATNGKNYNYWELSKLDDSLSTLSSEEIRASLSQISEIRSLYLQKYELNIQEKQEINQYTSQYYIFTYFCLLRQGIKQGNLLKALACITPSALRNIGLLLNIKNIKWIIKKI